MERHCSYFKSFIETATNIEKLKTSFFFLKKIKQPLQHGFPFTLFNIRIAQYAYQ